eukprot:1904873-Amphidinium_carterae.1
MVHNSFCQGSKEFIAPAVPQGWQAQAMSAGVCLSVELSSPSTFDFGRSLALLCRAVKLIQAVALCCIAPCDINNSLCPDCVHVSLRFSIVLVPLARVVSGAVWM